MSKLCLLCVFVVLSLLLSALPGDVAEIEPKSITASQCYSCCCCEYVMSAGGLYASGGDYTICSTLGQPTPIGTGSASGKTLHAGFWVSYWIPTTVEETPLVYSNMLFQNFPNPFNPTTTIQYSVATKVHVEIMIYNVEGRRIRTLVNASKAPGRYCTIWDGRNERGVRTSTGIYFCRLRAGNYVSVKKMLMLR